jgi:hypothetical protein
MSTVLIVVGIIIVVLLIVWLVALSPTAKARRKQR